MPAALEMLWESLDPATALWERFGFDTPTAAGDWIAATLHRRWGIGEAACTRIVISGGNALAWTTTERGPLIAKWSVATERFDRLARLADLTGWLAAEGLPVSAPLPALDGRRQIVTDACSLGLQQVIDADLLDVDHPDQLYAAGGVLARLQDALARYPGAQALDPVRSAAPLARRLRRWLESRTAHLPAPAREALAHVLDRMPAGEPARQLVHFDFRAANVLCADGRVRAVLDFEEARVEHRVLELARAAVLLATRFRDWGPTPESARRHFLDGYLSVRPLDDLERAWWPVLLAWQALAMVPDGADPTGWWPAAEPLLADLGRGVR